MQTAASVHNGRVPTDLPGSISFPHLLRAIGNALNSSTAVGLVVAGLGRAGLRPGPHGLVLAEGYQLPLPRAGAFTIGNVIFFPGSSLAERAALQPGILQHEAAHSWQYLACLGLPFLPLYALAAGWSWIRAGDPAIANPFEQLADLELGGYGNRAARPGRRSGTISTGLGQDYRLKPKRRAVRSF